MPKGSEKRPMGQRGGGIKPGTLTILGRRRAGRLVDQLEATGETPLDIMIDNMLFWHRSAQNIGARFREMLEVDLNGEADGKTPALSPDEKREAIGLLKQLSFARAQSQECAEGAARYMHPALSAIAVSKKSTHTVVTVSIEPPKPGEDRSYRDVYNAGLAKQSERERTAEAVPVGGADA